MPKTPPTAICVVETGSPNDENPSTVIAVANETHSARLGFSRVMLLPTICTSRRPNSTIPSAMPILATSRTSVPRGALALAAMLLSMMVRGAAILAVSLAPWAKPMTIAAAASGRPSSFFSATRSPLLSRIRRSMRSRA